MDDSDARVPVHAAGQRDIVLAPELQGCPQKMWHAAHTSQVSATVYVACPGRRIFGR